MTRDDSNPLIETNYDLLALRYISDEMTAAERGEIEAILAESQEAREAVATAVLMAAAIPLALAESESRKVVAPANRRTWARRVGWSAVGAAACLAGMLAIEGVRDMRAPVSRAISADGKEPSTQAMGELAQHWTSLAETDGFGTVANPDGDNAEAASDEVASADAAPTRDSIESADELAAPSWLLAAVAPIVVPPAQNPPASE